MPSRARRCAWTAACVAMLPLRVAAQERSVKELVDAIALRSPRAVAIRSEVDVTRREQEARLVVPNPSLLYSREGAGFTEFVQVEQPLPVFGVRGALRRAGVAAAAAAEADRDARLWELRAEALRAIARLLWAQARVDQTRVDLEAAERLVDVLRTREREGEGSRFDRLRAEHELAELKQTVVDAAVDVGDARGAVAALLPAGETVTRVTGTLDDRSVPLDAAGLLVRAQTARAELRALQFAVDQTTHEADAARRARWPTPIVAGGLKRAASGDDRLYGGVVGVNLALPLFDNGSREGARWSAEAQRMTAERATIEQQIRAEIARAIEALALRQRALAEAGGDTGGADLVRTAELAYREGEVGIVVVIDAVRTAARARLRDLERRLDVRLARLALERAVGEVLWP